MIYMWCLQTATFLLKVYTKKPNIYQNGVQKYFRHKTAWVFLFTNSYISFEISHKKPNVYQKGSSKILQTQDSISIFGKESVNNFLAWIHLCDYSISHHNTLISVGKHLTYKELYSLLFCFLHVVLLLTLGCMLYQYYMHVNSIE